MAWLKAMAWDLGANMDREVETSLMLAKVGPDQTADLWPDYPLGNGFDPIVTDGTIRDGAFDPDASVGSNRTAPRAWAGRTRSRTRTCCAPWPGSARTCRR